MTYFDTNLLIYFTIDQGEGRFELAQQYVFDAVEDGTFAISPLVLSEYIFVLSKMKILDQHHEKVEFFARYIIGEFDRETLLQAYSLCHTLQACRNINDAVHLKLAERHCERIVTFDQDFRRFEPHTQLPIEVLVP
jgi:predicted nucleic acid-binding protein